MLLLALALSFAPSASSVAQSPPSQAETYAAAAVQLARLRELLARIRRDLPAPATLDRVTPPVEDVDKYASPF